MCGNFRAVVKQGILRIENTDAINNFGEEILFADVINKEFTFDNIKYFVKEITDFDDLTDNPIYLSEKEMKNAVIRTRRQGDKIFFKDRNITKPLRKAMNEFKIPSELRDRLPLVAVNNEILWCDGINSVQTSYSAEKRKFIIICEQGRTFCA